jgi:hypothetical protein
MDSLFKFGEFFLFFLRNMANVLEVIFFNSFLEVALGFFYRQLAKFHPKKRNDTI